MAIALTSWKDGPAKQAIVDEESLATAEQLGWTAVSVKNDWTTVFKKQGGA